MTGRDWPPHPARHGVGRPPVCPLGDRFTTRSHALNALTYGYGPHGLHATPCPQGCGGWHNLPAAPPPPPPVCEPNWRTNPAALDALCEIGAREFHGTTAIHCRDVTTITAPEEYL